jgi:trans-aconitate methyltransferase
MFAAIPTRQFLFLAEAVAWRYRECGFLSCRFVLGKLKHDPVYRQLLNLALWNESGVVVDLGCGQGLFLTALLTARSLGLLPGGKSIKQSLQGVELDIKLAGQARKALRADGSIVVGDVRSTPVPACRTVLLIDVLYHLTTDEQDAVLAKAVAALERGGVLLLREADSRPSLRYVATWLAEAIMQLIRLKPERRRYRSATDWKSALEALGLTVETRDMSEGTPFANVLFIGRRSLN